MQDSVSLGFGWAERGKGDSGPTVPDEAMGIASPGRSGESQEHESGDTVAEGKAKHHGGQEGPFVTWGTNIGE